ALLNRKSA
ncbi:trk system potassium uptake trkA domain protein, partial [Vibrio parahaemolyticus V-223/04]